MEWPGIVSFFDGDGTGTLIAPTWILTAAHTARNIPEGHRISVMRIDYRLGPVVIHPSELVDIALVEIATPVMNVPTLKLYGRFNEQGQEVLLLGRGDFGNGKDGVKGVDHKLRRVTNRIDSVDKHWISMRFDPHRIALPGGRMWRRR